jgi:chemotaxis protein MotA
MAIGGDLITFVDTMSIFIVLGGGLAATLVSYRLKEMLNIFKVTAKAFTSKERSPDEVIRMMVDLSQKARKEGLLSLETEMDTIEDDFIKQAIQLVVDGVEPELIRDTMDMELESLSSRHSRGQGMYKTMATLFPAWGMIGTLIGLVQLLKSLNDPSKIGPAMAVALITTFYGSVLANLICNPIASKLVLKSKDEINQKQLIIEGILSLHAGENPKILESKLKTFLSPEEKVKYNNASNNPDKTENSTT